MSLGEKSLVLDKLHLRLQADAPAHGLSESWDWVLQEAEVDRVV